MALLFDEKLARSERQCKRRATRTWRAAVARRSALATCVEELWYGRVSRDLARDALRTWARCNVHYLARERSATTALAHWSGASRRSCWVLWRNGATDAHRTSALREASIAMLAACSLSRWRAAAAERSAQLLKMRAALSRLRHRLLALCFSSCKLLVARRRSNEALALQKLHRLLGSLVSMAWEGWRYFLIGRRNTRAASAAMCARALGRDLAAALWHWRQRCCEVNVLQSMRRRRSELLYGAMSSWARRAHVVRRVSDMCFTHVRRDNAHRLQRWHRLAAHNAALRLRQEYLISRTTWYARQAAQQADCAHPRPLASYPRVSA